MSVKTARALEIEFPRLADRRIGDFEIKGYAKSSGKTLFGDRVVTERRAITCYLPGKRIIPAVDILYRAPGTEAWKTIRTAEIPVVVESVLPKGVPLDINDIKGPLSYGMPLWFIAAVIAAAGAILAGFIRLIIALRRRAAIRLPHETALEELETLKGLLAQGGDVKEYYVRISDCVRQYIERRFELNAPEMTTEEFLESLRDSKELVAAHRELLRDFLGACDLVKFARYAPASVEIVSVHDAAAKFVNETKAVPSAKGGTA